MVRCLCVVLLLFTGEIAGAQLTYDPNSDLIIDGDASLDVYAATNPPSVCDGGAGCDDLHTSSLDFSAPLAPSFNSRIGSFTLSGSCEDSADCNDCGTSYASGSGNLAGSYNILGGAWTLSAAGAASWGGSYEVGGGVTASMQSMRAGSHTDFTVIMTIEAVNIPEAGVICVPLARVAGTDSDCGFEASVVWAGPATSDSMGQSGTCSVADSYSGSTCVAVSPGQYTFNVLFEVESDHTAADQCGCHGEACDDSETGLGVADFSVFLRYYPGSECEGDVTGDGMVDSSDLSGVLGAYGSTRDDLPSGNYNPDYDIDGDGVIGLPDLSVVTGNFGTCS